MSVPDGFTVIEEAELRDAAANLHFTIDEVSPFANPDQIVRSGDRFFVDHYYGQVYREMEVRPAAIYGPTRRLPAYAGDQLANDGFLRVPFRKVPRRIVRSREELDNIVNNIYSANDVLRTLFRGQTREYLIRRDRATSQWLFGEDVVLEPSLQASSARRAPNLEHLLPEWAMLLHLYLIIHGKKEFSDRFDFAFLALALAQHYGLATSGLDVTNNIEVALFFARMRFERSGGPFRSRYVPNEKPDSFPVIYILAADERQQFEYDRFNDMIPKSRPTAQSARFLHFGWGAAKNACVHRIFLALYLDPDGDFGPFPDPRKFFPSETEDRFARHLLFAADNGLPPELDAAFREGFYLVD